MFPYITCFCGASLGNKYELFIALRTEKYKKIKIQIVDIYNKDVDLTDIYDRLRIKNDCCRFHINTQFTYADALARKL